MVLIRHFVTTIIVHALLPDLFPQGPSSAAQYDVGGVPYLKWDILSRKNERRARSSHEIFNLMNTQRAPLYVVFFILSNQGRRTFATCKTNFVLFSLIVHLLQDVTIVLFEESV